jgi:hypothetical protein
MVQNYSSYKDFLPSHYSNVEIYFEQQVIQHRLVLFYSIDHQVEEQEHNYELVIDYAVVMFPVEI